ncbi:MAG: VOC family protein [Gemmatimonadaceae bacterium]
MKEVSAYLNFDGTCREAMTFYQSCLGGELFVMTFGDSNFGETPEDKKRLIHARLKSGPTMVLASDTMPGMPLHAGNNVWLHLTCERDDEVDTTYAALSAGGKPIMPPHDAFWGARFAMFADRFGINWMLNHERVKHG